MSDKCPGCGYYTLACQCRIDDNYCKKIEHTDYPDGQDHGKPHGCDRVISDCNCDHNDHWSYDNPSTFKYDNDDTCNEGNDD